VGIVADYAAERRDPEYYDDLLTSLNSTVGIQGSSVTPLNSNRFTQLFTAAGTYTTTEDLVITAIILNAEMSNSSIVDRYTGVRLAINGTQIAECQSHASINTSNQNVIKLDIPSWECPAGTVFAVTQIGTALAGQWSIGVHLIGYRLNS